MAGAADLGARTEHGMAAISSDTVFDRRFVRQFIDSLDVIPQMHTVAPLYPSEFHRWADGKQRPILCHSLYWALQAERHLRLYGDEKLKQEWQPGLKKALEGFHLYRGAEGLIENVVWDEFIDWSSPEKGTLQTFTNFIYGLILTRLGELYQDQAWLRDGRQTLETIERAAWNPGRELYADVLQRKDGVLVPGGKFSEVTNYIALWSGFVPPEREATVWRELRNFHPRTTDRALMNLSTMWPAAIHTACSTDLRSWAPRRHRHAGPRYAGNLPTHAGTGPDHALRASGESLQPLPRFPGLRGAPPRALRGRNPAS